jgi:hypothetical protein
MNDEMLAVLENLRGEIASLQSEEASLQSVTAARSNAGDIELEDLHKKHKGINKDLVIFA